MKRGFYSGNDSKSTHEKVCIDVYKSTFTTGNLMFHVLHKSLLVTYINAEMQPKQQQQQQTLQYIKYNLLIQSILVYK